ncbi:hypothetical protein H4219_003775 [Mycoemilia scoparia]|uniref:Uncharacterized protein n=1 Tax=Mycoemilia scoparia TaxID=417184 RepID=A0A9W8DS69_9FUNG|nr:hypothetical protein H4219_003775 [Mycoemilia scoparia]
MKFASTLLYVAATLAVLTSLTVSASPVPETASDSLKDQQKKVIKDNIEFAKKLQEKAKELGTAEGIKKANDDVLAQQDKLLEGLGDN